MFLQGFPLLLRSRSERLQLLFKSISLEVLQPFTSQSVTDSRSRLSCHRRLVIEFEAKLMLLFEIKKYI